MSDDNDFEAWLDSELRNMPDGIKGHFVQNGLCLGCNIETSEHHIVLPDDMSDEWTACWTETCGQDTKHFCVKTADHPDLITRDEFEELYG
jgi:hypothetical protein